MIQELEEAALSTAHGKSGDSGTGLAGLRLFPTTSKDSLERIYKLEEHVLQFEQVKLPTEHVIHAGMYARTIIMPAGTVLTGALMKCATLLILVGPATVLVGDEWIDFEGYNVIPGRAGRKQACISRSQVIATMLIPTQAKTVEEAEAEFTDQAEGLLSRRQDVNTVLITGE